MNLPPQKFVLVTEEAELHFIEECFRRSGMRDDLAVGVARLLVNSDLRGVRSHGIFWAPRYCRNFRKGRHNPDPDIRIARETVTTVVVDGDGFLGYMPTMIATEKAIDKARQVGVGMGLIRHIGHYGAAGHYTRMCTDAGCVGFSVQGLPASGSSPGEGPKPSVAFTGLPPMSFAMPGGEEPGVNLDMVANALSGYDGDEFADLPERIPAAFFKSMGLVATAALIGGGLAGFNLPEAQALAQKWPAADLGAMVLAIRRPSSRRGSSRRKRIATFAKPASRSRRCPATMKSCSPATWRSGSWRVIEPRGSALAKSNRKWRQR